MLTFLFSCTVLSWICPYLSEEIEYRFCLFVWFSCAPAFFPVSPRFHFFFCLFWSLSLMLKIFLKCLEVHDCASSKSSARTGSEAQCAGAGGCC